MTPGRVELDTDGWLLEGYVEGRADRQLQLTRQRPTAATPLQAGTIPPFVQVERELVLDVDWRVETQVRRLSQADAAAVLDIPLLPGERVTTPEIRVRDGRVLLDLPPDQTGIAMQVGLALLTLAAGIALVGTIEQGLLGPPDMQITGNHSSTWPLNWYQDRVEGPLPAAWVISAPMLLYRGLMLARALWLALAALQWLGWAWGCFSAGGLWRRWQWRQGVDRATSAPAGGNGLENSEAG